MTGSSANTPTLAKGNSSGNNDLDSFASQVRNIDPNNTSLDSLTQSLQSIFNCEASTIFVYDTANKNLYAKIFNSHGPDEIRVEVSFTNLEGYVAATGKPINIQDVHSSDELLKYHKDLKYDDSRDAHFNVKTRSMMLIPLPHKNRLTGVLEIINKKDGKPFSENDFIRAKAVSLVIGLALVKIEERERKNGKPPKKEIDLQEIDREDKMNQLSQAIQAVRNSDEIFSELQKSLIETFDASDVNMFAVDADAREVYSKISWNMTHQEIRLPVDPSTIPGLAAKNNLLLNINDVNDPDELKKYHQDLQFNEFGNMGAGLNVRSLLTVPLTHSNKLLGILQLVKKADKKTFDRVDEKHAMSVARDLAFKLNDFEVVIAPKPKKFSYLVENGYITDEELEEVNRKSLENHSDIEGLLIKDLYLRSLDVGKALETYYNIPYTGYDESIVLPNLEDFNIDYKTLRDQNWVPLKMDESGLVLLVNDPSNKDMLKEIERIFPNQEFDIRVGLKIDIQKYFDTFYGNIKHSDSIETKNLPGDDKLELTMEKEQKQVIPKEKMPMIDSCSKLFDEIITIAINQEVTDVHIEPGMENKNLLVRLRKEGACRVFEEIPSRFQDDLIKYVKGLAHLDPAVNKLPQNGKFVWSLGSNKYELSVVIFPTIGDLEDAMIRIAQIGKAVPNFKSMTEMDFSDPNLDKIMSRIHSSKGFILLTGPEGTGKTTSLHALLSHLNTPDKKIVTAESPVEIVQSGLRQLHMNEDNGLTYALALETFLLGNPDIILIGEIENHATLKLCVEGAQQRLIFSSMKAKSTIDAIRKMREMNIDPNQLGEAFLLIMAQKLVPSLCPHCKEDYHPSQEEFGMLEKFYGDNNFSELGFQYNENLTLKKAVGCKKCIFTGYSGQIALQEVLERTTELNRLIAENVPMEEIHNQALKDGMVTLNQDGIYKIMNGDCDFKKIQEAFLPGRF